MGRIVPARSVLMISGRHGAEPWKRERTFGLGWEEVTKHRGAADNALGNAGD